MDEGQSFSDGSLCFYHDGDSTTERIPIGSPIDPTEQLASMIAHVQMMGNNFADSFECDICGKPPSYKLNSSNAHAGRDVVNLLCSEECEDELQHVKDDMNEEDSDHHDLIGKTITVQPAIAARGRRPKRVRRRLRQEADRGRLTPTQMDIMGRLVLREREGRKMAPQQTQQLHNLRLLRNNGRMPVSMVPVPQPVYTYPEGMNSPSGRQTTTTASIPRPPIVFTPAVQRPFAPSTPFRPGQVSVMTVSANASKISISTGANRVLRNRARDLLRRPRSTNETALVDNITHITLRGEFPVTTGATNCAEVACPPDFGSTVKCWKCTDGQGNIVAPQQPSSASTTTTTTFMRPSVNEQPSMMRFVGGVQSTTFRDV